MTEETLGRRIAAHRKAMGLTQDALAERLGVTAQAVSKWENDQSCPDISLLPRLAEIFDITIDALLGARRKKEENTETADLRDIQTPELRKEVPDRKTGVGVALWLLATGLIQLGAGLFGGPVPGMWTTLGLTGLLMFGLFGLHPRFSVFRLGCALTGGYYLTVELFQPGIMLNRELLMPILLVFFGFSLLLRNAGNKEKTLVSVTVEPDKVNRFYCEENTFFCTTCFGQAHRMIRLPVLESGRAELTFGNLAVDLLGCGALAEDAGVELKCCFGSLEVYVPRQWQVQCVNKTVFASVRETGAPAAEAGKCLRLECRAAFGEICIKYV